MTDTSTTDDEEHSPPTESLGTVDVTLSFRDDVTADRVEDAFEESGAENFTDFALNYCEIGSERVEVDGE
jgi:hypothetical protein